MHWTSVLILTCFIPVDLPGDGWAVADPASPTPPLPVLQHPLRLCGDAAPLARLPVDFLCPSQGPFQELLLVGKAPWEYLVLPS